MINFEEELQNLAEQEVDSQFINSKEEVSASFQALNGIVTKLFKKQGAVSMQVEEMYSILEEQEEIDTTKELTQENEKMVDTLVTAADLIENFYLYYKEHHDEAMTPQSELMWNTLCKAMTSTGFTRIADEHTPLNVQLNTIEGVTFDSSVPNGYIAKVLKSGYLYNGKLYRKSTVLVNKMEEE